MSSRPLVAVLGSTVPAQKAAASGYPEHDLDLYPMELIQVMSDAGLLPIGLAVRAMNLGLEVGDIADGLVVLDQGTTPAETAVSSGDGRQSALSFVIQALAHHLPVLAIGSGERLLATALGELAPSDAVLSIHWDPLESPQGDETRSGPFNWLHRQITSRARSLARNEE
jgi:hypothetical protein